MVTQFCLLVSSWLSVDEMASYRFNITIKTGRVELEISFFVNLNMRFFIHLVWTLTLCCTTIETCQAATDTASFSNNLRFIFDVDGNQVDVYGAKINFFEGRYYFYGNSFSYALNYFTIGDAKFPVGFGIKSYSSIDLVNWKLEGYLYDPFLPNVCDEVGGCGRPHIIYNAASKKYVLWANAGSSGYIIATSTSPSTGFVFANSTAKIDPQFAALQPGDFAVESFGKYSFSKPS